MEKIEFDELLYNIKSTRNVNEIKQKLDRERWIDSKEKEKRELKKNKRFKQKRRFHNKDEEKEADELEEAIEKQKMDKKRKKVLDAPIHRQAQQRIEGKLAYRQMRNDLHQWQPIVNNLRVAEQLQFPERSTDNPLKDQTTEERAKQFVPRTELEQRITNILGKSKWNIKNGEEFSQAEREMLKTMELKEARRKCQELRKMRALMTFHAAKQKRQSKIKSKTFHRIRKRQERREMVKEIGTLLVENPTKATERIEQLEKDRAYERATLKHRGTNKWTKQVRKFATRNPELRKAIEDQLRLGRELKGLHGAEETKNDDDQISEESSMEENDAEKTLSTQKLVQMAVVEAGRDQNNDDKPMPRASENPFYRSALENIRRERKQLASEAKQRAANEIKRKDPTDENAIEKIVKDQTKNEETQKTNEPEFLDLNLRQIVQIPAELADGADSDIDVHHAFLAEAYEDDDVIGDFDLRKKRVEANEAPKEKNNRRAAMQGWGSWTGPGISHEKEKKRIDKILGEWPADKKKMRALKRRDAQMRGLIIREQVSDGIQKLQPKDVPFPFTRIQDFEAYIQQPLGRDWNTPVAVKQLTKPSIKTKSGRIIRPLKKNLTLDKNVLEVIGEEE